LANNKNNKCVECEDGVFSNKLGKCVKCPDFTTLSHTSSGCHILDVAHNKAYQMKFYLKGLKKKMAETCIDNNEFCYSKFVGPVRDHKTNDIFFISFSEKGN